MDFKFFSKNGEIVPIERAVVPLSNIEYQYGFGVYENIRVANSVPLFLSEHLERLENSAKILGLEHPFDATVSANVDLLVKKIGSGTYNLKILLIGGAEPLLYIIPLNPHFVDKKLYRDGVHLITYPYERPFPHAKSLNMLQSYLAYKKAKEAGAYDALLTNKENCITEGTRTNFFTIKGRTLYSPSEKDILLGVTRAAVLGVALAIGFDVEDAEIRPENLAGCDGAFITSTSSKILPVRSVDHMQLKEAPAALRELMAAFDRSLEAN